MTWILMVWFLPVWQVGGTGETGSFMTSAVFQDKPACVSAMTELHKMNSSINAACFPSASSSAGGK